MDRGGSRHITIEMPRDPSTPDSALVRAILTGDPHASAILFRRYGTGLFEYLIHRVGRNHHDAEDLTQEIFSEAIRNLSYFDTERSFWAWLCGIARRRLARYYRSGQLRQTVGERFARVEEEMASLLDALESDHPLPEQALARKEVQELVSLSLTTLSPRHRELLSLKYLQGLSLKEIGGRTGVASDAVSSALQRAREALRRTLGTAFKEFISHA